MTTFSTKSVLINYGSEWGMSGDASELKIPGFGTFTIADMVNVSAANGAAATKGVYTYTVAGAPGEAANMTFVIDVESTRWAAENVRFKSNPGNKYVFTLTLTAADTAATIAGKLRDAIQARIDERGDLPFTVSGATTGVILTMESEYLRVVNGNTGFMGAPYVESVATKREMPETVTASLAETTAPKGAVGLGKELEEDEFLATAATEGPYVEKITDRPIPGKLYNQFHFDIPRVHNHEVMGAPDTLKGSVSFSVYVLKDDEEALKATWNAIGAESGEGWTEIPVV